MKGSNAVLVVVLGAVVASACSLMTSLDGLSTGAPAEAGVADADGSSSGAPGSLSCESARGEKLCFGVCGSVRDPRIGCSAESCVACDPKNVDVALCSGMSDGFACSYGACDARHLDCDDNRQNGCERSKNSRTSCGDCEAVCEGATPFCAPQSNGFGCVATCPTNTLACDGACVDVMSDVENCGECGRRCSRAGATAACESGTCTFTCQSGLKECNGSCVSALDPATCGPGCTPCAAPGPNQQVTCAATGCVYSCAQGRFDCDLDRTNGCESVTLCELLEEGCGPGIICTGGCCPGVGCVAPDDPCLGGGPDRR